MATLECALHINRLIIFVYLSHSIAAINYNNNNNYERQQQQQRIQR